MLKARREADDCSEVPSVCHKLMRRLGVPGLQLAVVLVAIWPFEGCSQSMFFRSQPDGGSLSGAGGATSSSSGGAGTASGGASSFGGATGSGGSAGAGGRGAAAGNAGGAGAGVGGSQAVGSGGRSGGGGGGTLTTGGAPGSGGVRGTGGTPPGTGGAPPGTGGAPPGTGGEAGTGGSMAGSNPCAGLCTNPIAVSAGANSQDLGTGATCNEVIGALTTVVCGNFISPRTFLVNGVSINCVVPGNYPLPAKRNGGYCMQASSGNQGWAYFTTY